MGSHVFASVIVVSLFLCSGAVSLQVDDGLLDNVVADGLLDGAVNLLQAHMEAKKGQVRQDAAAKEEEEQRYSSKNSCSASEICSGGNPAASFKIHNEAIQVQEPEPKVVPASTADDAVGADTLEVAREVSASTSMLGMALQAVALLLVMNVLRRAAAAKCAPKEVTSAQAPVASAPAYSVTLFNAALAGNEAAFEAQISCGRRQALQVDSWGCTALHYAAKGGSAKIVKRLVELGACVDALEVWDETPLHIAARAGHAEVCQALLEAGAPIDALNAEENTPLVVAGRADKEAVCSLLVSRGAGVAGLEDERVPNNVAALLMQQQQQQQ